MPRIQNIFRVVSNTKLCPRFHRLCLDAPELAKAIKPGQFIHIRLDVVAYGHTPPPFFRRPFSVYRAHKHVEIFYEPVGPGTEILAQKKKGDVIDVLGPLGNPFTLPSKNIKQVVMIAGGIGVAPFLILSDALSKKYDLMSPPRKRGSTVDSRFPPANLIAGRVGRGNDKQKIELILLYGGRTKGHVYPMN